MTEESAALLLDGLLRRGLRRRGGASVARRVAHGGLRAVVEVCDGGLKPVERARVIALGAVNLAVNVADLAQQPARLFFKPAETHARVVG